MQTLGVNGKAKWWDISVRSLRQKAQKLNLMYANNNQLEVRMEEIPLHRFEKMKRKELT